MQTSPLLSSLLLILFLYGNQSVTSLFAPEESSSSDFLPKDLIPIHYDLFIRPILDIPSVDDPAKRFTTPGRVTIQISCNKDTQVVVFHRHPTLQVHKFEMFKQNESGGKGAKIVVVGHSFDSSHHFQSYFSNESFLAGSQYFINIHFTSDIAVTGRRGHYLTQYNDTNGNERILTTTQFGPIFARTSFPCFDEPDMKATFSLSIAHNANFNTLSNSNKLATNVTDCSLPKGFVVDIYKKTVKMSTYLVAWVVSNFICEPVQAEEISIRKRKPSLIPVQVCGRPEWISSGFGRLAVNASMHTLNYLEKILKHPYEMEKMDCVGIPATFDIPQAMENWGLVIYKERKLLYDPQVSTETDRQNMYSLVLHEFVHQYFGNLVSCKRWKDIWLKEGIAYYFQITVQDILPEFDTKSSIMSTLKFAMSMDQNGGPPLVQKHPSLKVVYRKGASIIRMLEGFLHKDVLYEALVEYLNRFKYEAVTQDDLFQVLTEFAWKYNKIVKHRTVKGIMDTWTLQSGFPLIRVGLLNTSHIIVSQEKFYKPNCSNPVRNVQSNLWEVPVAISSPANPDFHNHTPAFWLGKDKKQVVHNIDTSKWLVVNPDATGYFRVLYDDHLLSLIHNQLKLNLTSISALSRSQLIYDYMQLTYSGYVELEDALKFTTNLHNEREFVVWNANYEVLKSWFPLVGSDADFMAYFVHKVDAALDENTGMGWKVLNSEEKGSSVLFRKHLFQWALVTQSPEFLTRSWFAVRLWSQSSTLYTIKRDYHEEIYCGAVAHANREAFDIFWTRYKDQNIPVVQKQKFLPALGCTQNPNDIRRFLELIVDVYDRLNGNDQKKVLENVAKNIIGRTVFIEFLQVPSNIQSRKEKFGNWKLFSDAGIAISSYYKSTDDKLQILSLIDLYSSQFPDPDLKALKKQVADKINNNMKQMQEYGFAIKEFYSKQKIPNFK